MNGDKLWETKLCDTKKNKKKNMKAHERNQSRRGFKVRKIEWEIMLKWLHKRLVNLPHNLI